MDVANLRVEERGGQAILQVKVSAGASRTAVQGVIGQALKVSVTAVPEAGKANAAVIELLAKTLAVPKNAITIVRGATQPIKIVAIAGVGAQVLRQRLAALVE